MLFFSLKKQLIKFSCVFLLIATGIPKWIYSYLNTWGRIGKKKKNLEFKKNNDLFPGMISYFLLENSMENGLSVNDKGVTLVTVTILILAPSFVKCIPCAMCRSPAVACIRAFNSHHTPFLLYKRGKRASDTYSPTQHHTGGM